MKPTRILLGAALALAILPGPAAAELRIGYVNTARVLEEAPQADSATESLEKEFEPLDKKRKEAQRQLKTLEDRLARDGAIMSLPERRKLERAIFSARRDIKRIEEDFTEELNFRRNEEIAKLQKEIVRIIREQAQQEQFDLILTEGVLYGSPKVDITERVIERLRSEFSARGGKKK